ncbi:MAG TPA: GNAT family N-acetyltransferase [Fervidobacterium sp.]|nr:GNAT family N-acetyltransferase [Fervidobacterium sp.]
MHNVTLPMAFNDYIIREITIDDSTSAYKMRKNIASCCDTILATSEEISLEGMKLWIDSWLRNDKRLFVVVEDNKNIVGQLWVWFSDSKAKLAHVAEIGLEVLSTYQRKGIGSKLFEIGVEWARQVGAIRIQVQTLERNEPMRRIIEKNGFEYEGTKHCYVNNNGNFENMVCYARLFCKNDD